jgi:acid phosphatase
MAAGAIVAALAVAACASPAATATPSPTAYLTSTPAGSATETPALPTATATATAVTDPPSPSATPRDGIPAFRHIYVIVMENKEYGRIVGSSQAPYLNSLIARYGLTTNFYAVTHPSQPNYIALTSGGLQGTSTNGSYDLAVPNLFDQIEASGRTWRLYAQGYPGGCFKTYAAAPVADGPGAVGDYARKHNPAISYTSISGNPARCANITRLAGFDPAAADFEMIIPNQVNDMHSGSVAAGDTFLKAFMPQILDSAAFEGSVVFITWDEGDTDAKGGGHIATVVLSPGMTPGARYDGACTHYSMLRTIEQAWGLPFLGSAGTAAPIALPY